MFKKKKYLLVIIILLVTFLSIIIVNAQEVSIEISKTPPVITSPLKITPAPPYYYGDIISAEFIIANRNLFPITLNVLTVGGRDPDGQVADFTHRQNITIGPFEYYNYKGTLTLKKLGDYHFFCTYQTSDGNWNTNVDLGYGLTDEDRTKDIVVKVKEGQYIVPEISDKVNIEWEKTFGVYGHDMAHSIVQTGDGGYLVTGIIGGRNPGENVWVFKLDERGRVEWDKTFTRSKRKEWSIQRDMVTSFIQTKDGGYVISGYIDVSKTAHRIDSSATWVFKLNERGKVEWDKIFGEENDGCLTQAYSIIQTKDGGYALAGRTNAKKPSAGGDDIWVIKLNKP